MKPRLVGINHIALDVGSVDGALKFYGRILAPRVLDGMGLDLDKSESALNELRDKGLG